LLPDEASAGWRTAVLTEFLGETNVNDPDVEAFQPPNYHAMRSKRWLYVAYHSGSQELYDLVSDPACLRWADLSLR